MRVQFVPEPGGQAGPAPDRGSDELRQAMVDAGHTVVVAAPGASSLGFDIVHALSVGALAAGAGSLGAAPVVVSPRVTVVHSGGQGVVRVERGAARLLSKADGCRVGAVLTPSVASRVAWGATRPGRRVITVPRGVDSALFSPVGSAAVRPQDRLRVLFLGDLGPDSGAEDMVRILRLLPTLEVVLSAGPGTDVAASDRSQAVHGLACALGVGGRVSFARPFDIEHLPHVLRSSDVVVDVSGSDAGHELILAAMSCGRAVVTSDIGAYQDLVVESITGITVQHGNGMALKAALRSLVDDSYFLDSLGLAARDRAVSRYDWSRIATETVLAYERVLGDAAQGLRRESELPPTAERVPTAEHVRAKVG
jgi:glycosyltransferase involved in cell wall biosynthesis